MPHGLNSNFKLFVHDTSLFSVDHNITDSANLLNSDLSKINEWALQWKMSFNPTKLDPTKQAQEIKFSRKTSQRNHPGIMLNNNKVCYFYSQAFRYNIWFEVRLWQTLKVSVKKISKTVGLLQKFQVILPRTSLITIYKSFAIPQLDFGDIIYGQTF